MDTMDEVLRRQAARLRADVGRQASGERNLTHVVTGFRDIDDTYGGIRRGVATALVAHSGAGKSTFARQVAKAAAQSGAGVLYISAEDPEDATAERMFSDDTGITATEMGRLDLAPGELDRIDAVAKAAEPWAKRIRCEFSAPSVDECLEMVDDTLTVGGSPLLLTVVDYVQILGDANNLEAEVARLAREMAIRSGRRNLAQLLLSQAANDVIKRGRDEYFRTKSVSGFVPGKGDIEWCKRMEKSCKSYWVLDRPGMWMREMGQDAEDNTAELHVKKANFGPTGWRPLSWDGPGCRFSNKD